MSTKIEKLHFNSSSKIYHLFVFDKLLNLNEILCTFDSNLNNKNHSSVSMARFAKILKILFTCYMRKENSFSENERRDFHKNILFFFLLKIYFKIFFVFKLFWLKCDVWFLFIKTKFYWLWTKQKKKHSRTLTRLHYILCWFSLNLINKFYAFFKMWYIISPTQTLIQLF